MQKKKSKKKVVCVIGLGYVGLPLAVRCVEKGYETYGLDMDKKKVDLINKGKSPIEEKFLEKYFPKTRPVATTDEKIIKKADIVLICVPTPVDKLYNPDLGPVKNAVEIVSRNLKKGALMVLESTVNPCVSEEVIAPIFESHKQKVDTDVHIAHCPERINPGDEKWDVTNLPRVVGSMDKKGLQIALDFYRSIVDAEIKPMKSIRAAEAVKIVENSFRDINIAFVNELAKSFDKLDIDIKDVIEGASTKFSFMPHFPSCGVGGHCIPVDPYYLIERAKQSGFDHKFLKIARETNNSMPIYTVDLLRDALKKNNISIKKAGIGILGISYKSNVDDVRESPYFKILENLKKYTSNILSFDPHVARLSNVKNINELLKKTKALIVVTGHKEFKKLDPKTFKKSGVKVIVDGANCLDKDAIKKTGVIYKGIGR